jgi:hypothetical protein
MTIVGKYKAKASAAKVEIAFFVLAKDLSEALAQAKAKAKKVLATDPETLSVCEQEVKGKAEAPGQTDIED